MREIKFRAWDSRLKQWLDHHSVAKQFTIGSSDDKYMVFKAPYGKWQDGDKVFPERTILCMFTGMHDKNGVEIYEGDIVRVFSRHYGSYDFPAKFEKGAFGYTPFECKQHINPEGFEEELKSHENYVEGGWDKVDTNGFLLLDFKPLYEHMKYMDIEDDELEVIGNIYENSELLEEDK